MAKATESRAFVSRNGILGFLRDFAKIAARPAKF
jgi:hypothetical protein